MYFELLTPPSEEPLTLAETKEYLRVTGSDEDTLITNLIKAARIFVEKYTKMTLIDSVWSLWMDDIPRCSQRKPWWDGVKQGSINDLIKYSDRIVIQKYPISAVNSFKYYDRGDTEYTFDADNYISDLVATPPKITLKYNAVWPSDLRISKGISINLNAGYADRSSVPEDIRQGLLYCVAVLYENRGCDGTDKLKTKAGHIFDQYRLLRI
jgi:hypothetical protein